MLELRNIQSVLFHAITPYSSYVSVRYRLQCLAESCSKEPEAERGGKESIRTLL